jgi:GMP synthase-like glutamine amidotransferase
MRFHCLQHVIFETPGLLGSWIGQRGGTLGMTYLFEDGNLAHDGSLAGDGALGGTRVLPSEASVLPSLEDFDVLIIMGGPMSVHDEAEFSWLRPEKALIAAAIGAGKKVLGICLGAQLVAEVMGGRVYPNPVKEIGFWPVGWTEEALRMFPGIGGGIGAGVEELGAGAEELGFRAGEVGAGAGEVFHWHGETFDLPPGAVLLASSEGCMNQAFRVGENVLGIQFHPEVTPGIIDDMIRFEGHELAEEGPYIGKAEEMAARAGQIADGARERAGAGGRAGAAASAAGQGLLSALLEPFLYP